jgi:hypothetical protein
MTEQAYISDTRRCELFDGAFLQISVIAMCIAAVTAGLRRPAAGETNRSGGADPLYRQPERTGWQLAQVAPRALRLGGRQWIR